MKYIRNCVEKIGAIYHYFPSFPEKARVQYCRAWMMSSEIPWRENADDANG